MEAGPRYVERLNTPPWVVAAPNLGKLGALCQPGKGKNCLLVLGRASSLRRAKQLAAARLLNVVGCVWLNSSSTRVRPVPESG